MTKTDHRTDWTHCGEDGIRRLRLSGDWTREADLPRASSLWDEIFGRADDDGRQVEQLVVDGAAIARWDSRLAVLLRQLKQEAEDHGVRLDMEAMPEGADRLMALSVQAVGTGTSSEPAPDWLSRLGSGGIEIYQAVASSLDFLGRFVLDLCALFLGRARWRRKDALTILQTVGPQAVPIVSLLSFLTGLIIAFIGVIQLQKFGADIFVADLVGLATTRELGAVMAGVIMAGRTGAAFAAQIGSMQVNEEVDALTTFGIPPMQFLVLPRVIGLVLMLPLLCACANLLSIFGGMVVAVAISDVSLLQYTNQVKAAVGLSDLFVGLFKSGVFGLIIALSGCYRGLQCRRDAGAVGRAATSAVVTAITWIVIADAIFAVLFHIFGI